MAPQKDRGRGITLVGLNFKTAPLAVRESVAFTPVQLGAALSCLRDVVHSGVILSTCHRTEIYALADPDAPSFHNISRFLELFHQLDTGSITPFLYAYEDQQAVRHLFEVAGGLDSMIVGEAQILGQVREAFKTAESSGAVTHEISALFRRAIHTGKRIRGSTPIGRQGFGTYHAAYEIARKGSPRPSLTDCRILVIGAGKVGSLLVSLLFDNGVQNIQVANRTVERAISEAQRVGGQGWGLEAVRDLLAEVDVVFSAVQIDEPIITKAMLASTMKRRQGDPLLLIDTGLPSNIEPSATEIEGVTLFNVDDLYLEEEAGLMISNSELEKARDIIDDESQTYMTWFQSLEMVPTIVALRERFDEVRRQELANQASRLSELSEDQHRTIELLTNRITNKLLHQPTIRLKEAPSLQQGNAFAEMIENLFALDETD